jgi:hypothetical protein
MIADGEHLLGQPARLRGAPCLLAWIRAPVAKQERVDLLAFARQILRG